MWPLPASVIEWVGSVDCWAASVSEEYHWQHCCLRQKNADADKNLAWPVTG